MNARRRGSSVWQAQDRPDGRWRTLLVVALGVLLALAPWLSAAAVAPALRAEWELTALQLPLLTVAVQIGFAVGALALAAAAVPDVLPTRVLFFAGAVFAAAANAGFGLLSTDFGAALALRFLTGLGLAAVYPVALRLIVGWFRAERGAAVGILIGALTIGSALPYLISGLGALSALDWRVAVLFASGLALVGGAIVLVGTREGPFDQPSPRFSPGVALRAFREPSVRLANLGYLGHMWELYAMWTWIPLFLAASFAAAGVGDVRLAGFAAFAVVAGGGAGCIVAGLLADRFGRTTTTIAAMAGSGTSAILAGALFGAPATVVVAVTLFWGITIVADSAQFSAAVSELAPPGTAGSALSLQLASGFLLTAVSILLVGALETGDGNGWRIAFWLLAIGPAVGIVAMWRLRKRPESVRLAGGHR